MTRPDPFGLVVGVAAVLFGALALACAGGLVPKPVAAGLVPVVLICCGVAGLALSRFTSSTRIPKGK